MKKIVTIMAVGVILLGFSPAQAALTWLADYYEFNYDVSKNGGGFFNWTYGHFQPSLVDIDKVTNTGGGSGLFTGTARGEVDGFAGIPGSMNMIGTARGESSSLGSSVYGSAAILPAGLTSDHMVDVDQAVTSWISRRFTVDGPGLYTLSADLFGSVSFPIFGDPDSKYHGFYSVEGTVSIEAFKGSGGAITSLGAVGETITLSDAFTHDDLDVELYKQIGGEDVFYQLAVVLNLTTDLQNFDWSSYMSTGDISGFSEWLLGEEGAPLQLSAEISQVPLPGSVLLLISGLGGLAVSRIRHRSWKAG